MRADFVDFGSQHDDHSVECVPYRWDQIQITQPEHPAQARKCVHTRFTRRDFAQPHMPLFSVTVDQTLKTKIPSALARQKTRPTLVWLFKTASKNPAVRPIRDAATAVCQPDHFLVEGHADPSAILLKRNTGKTQKLTSGTSMTEACLRRPRARPHLHTTSTMHAFTRPV